MGQNCYRALVLLSILFGAGLVGVAEARKLQSIYKGSVPAIFAFGDSLVDSGTNNFIEGSETLANFLPYGETFFRKATGRFTNGRHVFDFIASFVGLPFMPPFLQPGATFCQGANFGSGGSGILSTTGGNGVISLSTQVEQFEQVAQQLTIDLGAASAADLISKSLFFVNTGGNDFSAYLGNATLQQTVSPAEFIASLLSQLGAEFEKLYALGARKVVVFGVGPLGCVPQVMAAANATNGQCVSAPNELVQAYNTALQKAAAVVEFALPDLNLLIGNAFDAILNLATNGTAQGFTAGSTACCGSGPFNAGVRCGPNNTTNLCNNVDEFVFWDIIHPTERVYHLLAELLWKGEPTIIQPISLQSLALL